jgi:hypothetical protein
MLFHILRLSVLILAWPNRDPRASELRVLFADVFLPHVTDTVSLCVRCEPRKLDAKDRSQLILEIHSTLRN